MKARTGRELFQPTRVEALATTTRMQVLQRENVAMFETCFEIQSRCWWEVREFICTGIKGRKESKITPGLLAEATPKVVELLPVLVKTGRIRFGGRKSRVQY